MPEPSYVLQNSQTRFHGTPATGSALDAAQLRMLPPAGTLKSKSLTSTPPLLLSFGRHQDASTKHARGHPPRFASFCAPDIPARPLLPPGPKPESAAGSSPPLGPIAPQGPKGLTTA